MKKINKHIEIVRSEIIKYSSMSAKSCDMVAETLKKHYARVEVTYVNKVSDIELVVSKSPDLVFLGIKNMPLAILGHKNPDKIWISDYLDQNGINYTGSTREAIELDHNKDLAKQVIADAGLATAAFFTALPKEYKVTAQLPLAFPLFIKPPREGGGTGISNDSIVHNFSAFTAKVQSIYGDYNSPALVEKYLDGREFSVAILGHGYGNQLLVMPIEIIAEQNSQGDRILSNEVKTGNSERIAAVPNGELRDMVVQLAKNSFRALGARDYGRIDIRLDETGTAHFLEANLIPSLIAGYGSFPKACVLNMGIGYQEMLLIIVTLALERSQNEDLDTGLDPFLRPLLEIPA